MDTRASTYHNQGRWRGAVELRVRVLKLQTKMLREEHPDTLTRMANLAATYGNQGRWTEAEEFGAQVIESSKKVLGEEHPDTLTRMANLAATYWNQGRWTEAEELGVRVLELQKKVLGEEHPDTLRSISNLAATYWNQDRWTEAEELEVQVMELSKKVLGEEHPDTLMRMANLAATYWNQGRWKEAEELEVQVTELSKKVLGEEHPDTLRSISNLSVTYGNQGRWEKAQELEVQVMEMSKKVLGEEHPDTLTRMANLAATYRIQDRWTEAEELEAQVIELSKKVLGEEHPDTLTRMANLSVTYGNQGRWTEAEELEVQVTELSKKVLGEEHPDTLTSISNLSVTYGNQGRWTEAEELGAQVIELSKKVLGEEHPDTLTRMANLAATYLTQGRLREAEELEVRVLELSTKVLGEEHPDTLTSMANLAVTHHNQGRWTEAEELGVRTLELQKKMLGEEHPHTLASMANLASMYQNQCRWKEAEELGVQVLEIQKKVLGEEHPSTLASVANLVSTYRDQGRLAEAEDLEAANKFRPRTVHILADLDADRGPAKGAKDSELSLAKDQSTEWAQQSREETQLGPAHRMEALSDRSAPDDDDLDFFEDLDDIDVLLDPASYFTELDYLEMDVVKKCLVEHIFSKPFGSRHLRKQTALYSHSEGDEATKQTVSERCRNVLVGILSAINEMQTKGFCGDCINILVEDETRPNVVRVVDLYVADIQQLSEFIETSSGEDDRMILDLARKLLQQCGASRLDPRKEEERRGEHAKMGNTAKSETTADKAAANNTRDRMAAGKTKGDYRDEDASPSASSPGVDETISLLCSVLALAAVSYAGSHCSDLGQVIWTSPLASITFEGISTTAGKQFTFLRRRLACLDECIGGPVWTFGGHISDGNELPTALLSASIKQFAALWGPLFAVPSSKGFDMILALQTESGILFRSIHAAQSPQLADKEVLLHWIKSNPPTRERQGTQINDKFVLSSSGSQSEERLPSDLIPFPRNCRLLIGYPAIGINSSTTTTTFNITMDTASGLQIYPQCPLNLERYAAASSNCLHPLGAYEAYYAPDQYQMNLTAGQYVSPGLAKVWKRIPARTWKSLLVMKFADERTIPDHIRKFCELRIGVERSACTENAQRISLLEALKLAFPLKADYIQEAYEKGTARDLAPFVVELALTGFDPKGRLLFFWPFSGTPDGLELPTTKPNWRDLLKDGRDTACFAVISRKCLEYYGYDDLDKRRIRTLCACRSESSRSAVLYTTIALHPNARVSVPLTVQARVRLADGFLEIRNRELPAQLACYERRNLVNRVKEIAICTRDGSTGHHHREHLAVHRTVKHPLPVCIIDKAEEH